MKIERLMLIMLLLTVLTIGVVSASEDTNDTLTVNVDEVSWDTSCDELISESGDESIAAVSDDVEQDAIVDDSKEVLSANENNNDDNISGLKKQGNEILKSEIQVSGNTFEDIQNAIDSAHNGDTLILKGTYTGTQNIIVKNIEGLTIIGQNDATLDAQGQCSIFRVNGRNVTIKNITLKNGKQSNGGAVYWTANNGRLINCTFINNTATKGGAIYLDCSEANVNNCTFINNTATINNGGAVYWSADNGRLINCTFINNTATNNGGAIALEDNNKQVINCIFINNTATNNGGAISLGGNIAKVNNCTFTGNTGGSGGAIVLEGGSNKQVNNCIFINNTATNSGAIYLRGYEGNVNNCIFINNTATNNGGAIYLGGYEGIVNNSIFINNTATNNGGAIFLHGMSGYVHYSNFTGNTATNGAAIAIDSEESYCNLEYCSFDLKQSKAISGNLNDINNCVFDVKNLIKPVYDIKVNDSVRIGEKVDITITAINSTEYNVTINGIRQDVLNNKVTYTPVLPGNFTITVSNIENETHFAGSFNKTVNVLKKEFNVSSIVYDFYPGKRNVTVKFTLPEDFKGNISVIIDDKEYSAGIEDVILLSSGKHNITGFKLTNDSTYEDTEFTISEGEVILVSGGASDLANDIKNAIDNNQTELNITNDYIFDINENVPIIINKSITINGNGHIIDANGNSAIFKIIANNTVLKNLTINNTNGTAINTKANNTIIRDINFNKNTGKNILGVGNNTVVENITSTHGNATLIEINGDDSVISDINILNHNGDGIKINGTNNKVINLTSQDSTGNIVDMNGDNASVNNLDLKNHKGTCILTDGVKTLISNVTVNGGKGTVVHVKGLNATINKITVRNYDGVVIIAPDDANISEIDIEKIETSITANSNNYVISYGGLYSIVLNPSLSGKTVKFQLNGKYIGSAVTGSDGKASIFLSKAILGSVGSKVIAVSFDGDESYNASSASAVIVVNKEVTKITAKSVKKTYKKSKTKKLKITLKNSKGKSLGKVKITLKVNKKLKGKIGKKLKKGYAFTVKFNSKGVGYITLNAKKVTGFKKGTYKFTVTYKGSNLYNAVTKNNIKMKVK